MAIRVYAEIGKLNHIGRVGENKAEILVFDVDKQITSFGTGGEFTLLIRQNGELFTEEQGSTLIYINANKTVEWTVTNTYTTIANQGKCQLVYTKNDGIIKSEIYDIIVTEAFDEEGDE